jgi:hypothetical protein
MPDGEVGDRRYWIDGIAYRVLNGHPEIETLRRPAPDADGVERWRPQGIDDQFQFRVKRGVERVRFGDPGWRLGYARDAAASYFVFRQMKKDGVIPAHVRFQVCLPLTTSAVASFFPDAEDLPRIVPGFTAALAAEVAKIAELIPAGDLAIQWDLAVENRFLEATVAREGEDAALAEAADLLAPARAINAILPEAAALGYHSCFGTLNGWPSRQPPSLLGSVMLLNEAVRSAGRRVDFLHFPTLGRGDAAFFAPLAGLEAEDARVYLGAIHHMHDEDGLKRQIAAAGRHLGAFGLAAPCGFGRVPERPGMLSIGADPRRIIDDHLRAAELLRRG